MDKQIKYLVGVLILILAAAFFLSLLGELPQYFKDDIIAFLEEEYEGEIAFDSVSIWPLNRIRLKSFSYLDQKGNKFAVEELKIDYSLNFSDFNNFIKIKFIEAEAAELLIRGEIFSEPSPTAAAEKQQEKSSAVENSLNTADIILPQILSEINLNLINSKLQINNKSLKLELNNLNLGLKAEAEDVFRLNLSTAAAVEKIAFSDFKMKKFSSKKLKFELIKNNDQADFYFQADNLDSKYFLSFLDKKKYNLNDFTADLSSLEGSFSTKAELKIKKDQLKAYQAEFDLSGLKLKTLYSRAGIKENFDLNFTNFSLLLSGPDLEAAVVKNNISIDNNQLNLDFKIKKQQNNYNYQAKISAADFVYDYDFFNDYLSRGNFNFSLNLQGENSKLNQLNALLEADSTAGKYGDFRDSKIEIKFLDNEIFIETAELELENDSRLNLEANYNLADGRYQLKAEAEDFLLSQKLLNLLEEYQLLQNLSQRNRDLLKSLEADQINFELSAAGYNKEAQTLSAAGNFNLDYNLKAKENNLEIKSDFWLAEKKLYLESFNLTSDFAYLDLIGEIDFAERQFKLRYAAKNVEIAALNKIYDFDLGILEELNPGLEYLEGKIANSFSNPNLSLDLKLRAVSYQDYLLENIEVKAAYQNDNLKFREIKADLNQGLIRAQGEIENISSEFLMDFNLKSENLYYQDLAALSNSELPLSGQINFKAALSGTPADYKLDFNYNSDNIILNYHGREFDISNLKAVLKKEADQFKISTLSFEHRNLFFKAAGLYDLERGFDLQYNLGGIEVQNYLMDYPQAAADFAGSISFAGKLQGFFDSLIVDIRAESEALIYDGFEINFQENKARFNLNKMKLDLDKFNFSFAGGEYQLKGKAFDFTETLKSSFELNLLKTPTAEFFNKYLGIYPFAEELILNGTINAETEGSQYLFEVDLAAEAKKSEKKIFNLSGEINREIFLDFEAESIPIEFSSDHYGFNFRLLSQLDLSGNLRGSFDSPVLILNHKFYDLKINNTVLESFAGNLILERERRFSISENIKFVEGGELTVNGSYFLNDEEFSFNSKLNSLPLDFVLSFVGDQLKSDAVINGKFRGEGTLSSPDLSGLLTVEGKKLELGLWNSINDFSTEIELKDEQAVVKKAEAKFGEKKFNLTGHFNLFEPDQFWQLNLNAKTLYFDYGSLAGDFKPEIEFSGPLTEPLLKGEIELNDFLIKIPFEWPAADNEADAKTEPVFMPRIDLKLIPDDNVRVKNPNIDILVEKGDLNLNYNHRRQNPLMMEGELSSQSGRFTYYNSRFNLNNADAVFTPVDERDIPSLQVNATTYAGGREINVNLTGPADNMNISFTSSPEMTEEEILNLLSSRGALGSAIIGGEDIGIQQIVFQELLRITNSFLQQDLISDLESDFRTAFSLDRIEIDALQYGLNREFAIYLGKNLNNRFYLGYAAYFGEEARDNEISFQYKLTESTNLKGSYIGDGDYEITVETEIDF